MSKTQLNLNILLILFVVYLLGGHLLTVEVKANEVDKPKITTKDAILLALTDLERIYGKLPTRFLILFEDKASLIEVSLGRFPVREGGGLTIVINKKTGKIVERIKGQ